VQVAAAQQELSVESKKHLVGAVRSNGLRFTGLALSLAVLLAAGCKSPEERMRAEKTAEQRGGPRTLVVGKSVEGRPIECIVFGDGADVVMFLATIHGNEPAGTPLLHKLADHLARRPDLVDHRQIVLLPLVNPDGAAQSKRLNVHGVDLNRNFLASNYESGSFKGSSALSEPESAAVNQVINTFHPSRIVSLHQPANEGNACIDYDGPAEALAAAMAAHCDLPVKQLGCRSGSLGSYAGLMLGIPIVTAELPKDAHRLAPDALWDHYGQMLLAAIVYPASKPGGAAATAR
jgi:murein peptide amidase A